MTTEEQLEILEENRRMRKALKQIHEWQLPEASFTQEGKNVTCAYEVAYGSNGARNYIRNLAGEALKGN